MRTGNSSELANEPNAPMVFIAADSVPEYLPPTSQQTGQLALTVRSTPNVVKAKQAMNHPAECVKGAGSNVAAASPNPNMAGRYIHPDSGSAANGAPENVCGFHPGTCPFLSCSPRNEYQG